MLSAFRIFNQLAPKQGPKAIRVELDFSAALSIELDLEKEQESQQIEFIQAMWAELKDFPTRIDLAVGGLPMPLSVPAFSQGMFPILSPGILRVTFSTSAVSLIKPVFIFMNVPQPYFVFTPGL